MPALKASFFALFMASAGMAAVASAAPVVSLSRSLNIDGSGYDALDFFYASSADAEFTNYRLNFETTNGEYIFDPDPRHRQSAGSSAIDTFMNTVGSSLGLSDAVHIQSVYRPPANLAVPSAISHIDWDVFDTFAGDTNTIGGAGAAPYHLARILVDPQAEWNAAFTAYDTVAGGVGTKFKFVNSLTPEVEQPLAPLPMLPAPQVVYTPPPLPPVAPPVTTSHPSVSMTRSHNIDGSGYNALDFFYASTPGAEFTNYKLNLETTNGAHIFDPDPKLRQSEGGQAIDTFMNTVGSSLGLSDAAQIYSVYKPSIQGAESQAISHIDWDVFDTLSGDTNEIGGDGAAPFHMARVLISPEADWNASFTAYNTFSQGVGTKFNFLNSTTPVIEEPVVAPPITTPPDPTPVIIEPTTPPAPVDPVLPAPPTIVVIEPPASTDPPSDSEPPILAPPELPTESVEFPIDVPLVWLPYRPWIQILQPFDPATLTPGEHLIHVDENGEVSIMSIDVGNLILGTTSHPLIDFPWRNSLVEYAAADQPASLMHLLSTNAMAAADRDGMAYMMYAMSAGAATSGDLQQTPEPTGAILAMFAAASLCAFRYRR